jgi:hypothetical protein
MSKDHTVLDAVHEATHRLPGVPQHQDYPEGHQGTTRHGRSLQNRPLQNRGVGSHQGSAPAHDRPPRVLVGWQNWIAGLFSRKTD